MKTTSILCSAVVVAAIAAPAAQADLYSRADDMVFNRGVAVGFDAQVSGEADVDIYAHLGKCHWSSKHRLVCWYRIEAKELSRRHIFFYGEVGKLIDKHGKWHFVVTHAYWPTRG